ncbi:MAG TPA: hypothetical protein VFB20_10115 [Burkholderiales bacterium]|nr:hypothetical protein [Burkholderiales bacterium]
MGLEIVFFLGAFLLLAAMIYGTLSWHYRDRAAVRAAEEVTRTRYRGEKSAEVWPVDAAPPDTARADAAPADFSPRGRERVREPVGIEPEFSEDDIQRAQLGPRGVPGAADPAKMTPQRAKKTPGHINQGHVS